MRDQFAERRQRVQHAAWMIYLQTAVFAIAVILNAMLVYEASPRTWRQLVSVAIFAVLVCYQVFQWPMWSRDFRSAQTTSGNLVSSCVELSRVD